MHVRAPRWLAPAILIALSFGDRARARGEEAAAKAVEPIVKTYCIRCHDAKKHKGDVDLTALGARPSTLAGRKVWRKVLEQLQNEEMPPEDPLPSDDERRRLIAWVEGALKVDGAQPRNPGRVTIPRLTRDEYNNTMRDLLGIDVQPGNDFAPDGEGASGFSTDRDSLFLTPSLLEKYLAAAGSALDACAALQHKPASLHFEAEDMFMTETRERPRDLGDDFTGYVLNRGQMTLYTSVRFPHDGFYTFTARVRSTGRPAAARLRIDGETKGDVLAQSPAPRTVSVTGFVKEGSRQMTWNIQGPDAPPLRPQQLRAQAQAKAALRKGALARGTRPGAGLPPNGQELVNTRSEENRPRYPVTGKETPELLERIRRVDAGSLAVQRPYEWLRILGPTGDPAEIARFKSYIVGRGELLDASKDALAEALGVRRAEVDRRFAENNRERLADNKTLLDAVAHIAVPQELLQAARVLQAANPPRPLAKMQTPGSIGIDWIEVRGPVHPAGAAAKSLVFTARPGDAATPREAARTILTSFLPRAFRRPVEPAQVDRYLAVFDRASARGDTFEKAVSLALSAVLVSPNFLYRNEFGPIDGEYRLDDYHLASRLSYFLWMSMPDETLFALAKEGRLHDEAVLTAQVERMLADPKTRAFTTAFLGQWLGFDSLGRAAAPDPSRFPEFTPELSDAMKQEPVLLFEALLREGGSLLALIDTRETWLNERLARHYGIEGVLGPEMRRVRLDDPNRGGLLGMASVMTVTSGPTRTNPVIRGRWVLETLLGETMPEPPADAGTLDPDAGEVRGKTLRDELLAHRRNASCAGCHNKIDPIGFGLENFDPIGRFRTTEAGRPLDNSGELPDGTTFRGPAELKTLVLKRRSADFVRNAAERLLGFALGRKLELHDEPALQQIVATVEKDGFRARTLVTQVVLSYPFQYQNNRPAAE